MMKYSLFSSEVTHATQCPSLVGLYVLSLAFLAVGCRERSGTNDSLAGLVGSKTGSTAGLTGLPVQSQLHDFGAIQCGANVAHEFQIENTFGVPTRISFVRPGCSCTVAEFTETVVGPGEFFHVRVKLVAPPEPQRLSKSVIVQFHGEANLARRLDLRADVLAALAVVPNHLIVSWTRGKSEEVSVKVAAFIPLVGRDLRVIAAPAGCDVEVVKLGSPVTEQDVALPVSGRSNEMFPTVVWAARIKLDGIDQRGDLRDGYEVVFQIGKDGPSCKLPIEFRARSEGVVIMPSNLNLRVRDGEAWVPFRLLIRSTDDATLPTPDSVISRVSGEGAQEVELEGNWESLSPRLSRYTGRVRFTGASGSSFRGKLTTCKKAFPAEEVLSDWNVDFVLRGDAN